MTLIKLLLLLNAIHSVCICQRREREREGGESLIHQEISAWSFVIFSALPRRGNSTPLCYSSSIVIGISLRWDSWNPHSTKENYSRWMRTAYFNLHFNLLSPVLHCDVTQVQSFYGPARLTQLGQQPRFVRPGRDHYYRSSMSRLV